MHFYTKILNSTEYVCQKANSVHINPEALKKFAWSIKSKDLIISSSSLMEHNWELKTAIWLILTFNSANFSFWPEENKQKWGIQLKNKYFDGSTGLFKAIENSVYSGRIKATTEQLVTMNRDTFLQIIGNNQDLPLIDERINNLRELGQVLVEKYNGQSLNLIEESNNNVIKLIELIIKNFPSYRDEVLYKGRSVYFYKRVQLIANMIFDFYIKKGLQKLEKMENLTLFADYRISQLLNSCGILTYSKELEDKIMNEKEISAGTEEEIEIRAATIQSGEALKQLLMNNFPQITSSLLDSYLWTQSKSTTIKLKPHHRTRTIYY